MRDRLHLIIIICIFIAAIIGGAFIYHGVEGWTLLDAFYFVVVTVTTIGYGDLVPATSAGKIFTIFYGFFGVATALIIFSKINSSIFKKHVGQKVSEIKKGVRQEEELKEGIEKSIKEAVKDSKQKNKFKKSKKKRAKKVYKE